MAARPTGRRRPAGRRGGGARRAGSGVDGRIRLLRFVFIVFLVLVGGKAVALASSSERLTKLAVAQQSNRIVLPAHRGSILDRNGDELAVGKPQQTVYADPHLLADPVAAAEELCDALQINRRRAAQRSRFMRTFVVFVACLTVLAVGRVARSFAVVQKTLLTDAIVHEERRVSDKNAELREEVARLASAVRIRHIAESDLGLVDAKYVLYPKPLMGGTVSEVAASR